jgi:hypothetical protein
MKFVALVLALLFTVIPVSAFADDFATVEWIRTATPKGKWKNVDTSPDAVLVTETGDEIALKKGMSLDEDALVRTGMARVGVSVQKNTIEIHEGSEGRIQDRGVLQSLGNLYYKVRGAFKVTYGSVEAVVEGTEFEFHGPSPKWVGVKKGLVRVITPTGEVLLKKDQKVEVNADGTLSDVKSWTVCLECGQRHEDYD